MRAPGTAYDDPTLGEDPQPDHMSKFVQLGEDEDNGGVHINSGIPNKAFYLVATAIGGPAWDQPGHIWYESLRASSPDTQFQDFAETTFLKAGQLYGRAEQQLVREAWSEVGLDVGVASGKVAERVASRRGGREEDTLAELEKQVRTLSKLVEGLTKQLARQKEKA